MAAAHHQIDAVGDGGHQPGEGTGVVLKIGIHFDQGVPSALETPGEACPVGAAEPRLGRPSQDVDVAQLCAQFLRQIGGAVGATVVHDEDPGVGQRGSDGP